MIFQHTYQLILDGKKTQTRRLVKGDKPPCRAGQSLAVQPGRGKKAVCRVLVDDVRCAPLGAITQEDVQAEGYQSLEAFKKTWQSMHGGWDPESWVWVITFHLP